MAHINSRTHSEWASLCLLTVCLHVCAFVLIKLGSKLTWEEFALSLTYTQKRKVHINSRTHTGRASLPFSYSPTPMRSNCLSGYVFVCLSVCLWLCMRALVLNLCAALCWFSVVVAVAVVGFAFFVKCSFIAFSSLCLTKNEKLIK